MNLIAVGLVGWLVWLNYAWRRRNQTDDMDMAGGTKFKRFIALAALSILALGILSHLMFGIS